MFTKTTQRPARRIVACIATVAIACGLAIPGIAQDGVQDAVQQNAGGQAAGKLDTAIGSLAQDIMKYMAADEAAGKSIVLETLRGPNRTVSGRVAQLLRTEFEKAEYKIVGGGAYTVTGRFQTGERDGQSVARFNVQLLDRSGAQVNEYQQEITDLRDGVNLLAPTFDASQGPAQQPQQLKETITEAVEKPNVFTANSVIKATPDSPYGIEILVWDGTKYSPTPVDKSAGVAQCDVKPTQEFAIRVHNETNEFVGAQITLDGINMYAFSKNSFFRDFGRMAIFPKQAPLIKGWHDQADQSFSFKVTNYGESAAAKLGVVEGVGTITVTFFKAYEDKSGNTANIGSDQAGVGFGTPRKMVYTRVPVKIPANEIIGAISVQYARPVQPLDLPDGG
ncbi:MAG: hypothetical protein MPJ50_10070 [Pirellulales bacterium]|nr:hypothetical protein [Pirellulales bacterium]